LTPQVGFSGSGFFNKDIREFRKMLDDHGLKAPSLHTDLDTLSNKMGALAEGAHTLNSTYVVLPAIPDEKRKTLDDYKRMAELFNKIGAEAKARGIRYAYHNHGYGLSPMDGQIPLNVIFEQTDPKLVFFEMDLYWTTAGGADPIELLTKHKGRYRLMHVKDMKKKVHFSGDGGDAKQWIELWDYMTTVGDGVLDIPNIVKTARANGLEHFIVEQDIVKQPEIALKRSYDHLSVL
jgi:sugar phosphate isomerase/epimerase